MTESLIKVVDTEGFEPSVPVKVRTLSRGVVSATHPRVRLSQKENVIILAGF